MPEANAAGWSRFLVIVILVAGLAAHLWGVRRDLPYAPEADESVFVGRAVRIVSTGDPNPHWFGHPGSTVIYPLAGVYHLWSVLGRPASLLRYHPVMQTRFASDPGPFFLLGRLLSIGYALLGLTLVYVLGRHAFDESIGLIGCWFAALDPMALDLAQMVRTDSAACFFGLLALWRCLALYDHPSARNHCLAGAAIGLGMATRYFLVTLVPVLALVDVAILWRREEPVRSALRNALIGLVAAPVTFVFCTPYLVVSLPTVLADLQHEARTVHPGVDALGFWGNLHFYVTEGLPASLPAPLGPLAALGVVLVLARRLVRPLLLLLFTATFMVAISFGGLHWQRWLVQVAPLLALLAAAGLVWTIRWGNARLGLSRRTTAIAVGLAVVLVSWQPTVELARVAIRKGWPSTAVVAREWLVENLPAHSLVAEEWYTVPLTGAPFVVLQTSSLAEGKTLEWYARRGYRYLIVSDAIYARFTTQPERHPDEAAFYQRLFREGHRVEEFAPSPTRPGPRITVYALAG
jgi:hypothetical protein